jgi:hypothetical protein
MAIGSGLGSQVQFGIETTYGTSVTPTVALEATSVGLELQSEYLMSEGLRAGLRVQRGDRTVVNRKGVSGEIELDITSNALGRWLIHAMGDSRAIGSIKTTPSAGVYLYTTRLGDPADLASMTIQTGVADVAGNVRRMDAVGCFITEFSLSNETDGILTGSFTVDGRDYIPSASAVTAASYASGTEPLVFHQGAITVGGTAVPLKSYELSVTHGYDVERYQINSTSLKSRPIINAKDEITLTLEMEFDGTAAGATWATSDFVSKFRAGTKVTDIVGAWTGGTAIASTYYPSLTATVPQAVITAATPTIDGPEIVALSVELMVTDNGTDQPLTLAYQTSENLS